MQISFIGLGAMGYFMAGHIANKGLDIVAYNRSEATANKWGREFALSNARASSSLQDCAKDVVCLCVSKDEDVREVVAQLLPSMTQGSFIIDHSTTSYELATEMAELCEKRGVTFVDAPVSGGVEGAKNGVLTVMAGCDESTLEKIKNIIDSYAKNVNAMGQSGHGQLSKMVNQMLICGVLQGLSEGIDFAVTKNLNIEKLVNTLKDGAAGSWQLANRGNTMAKGEFDFGFAIDLMMKDLGYCADESQKSGKTYKTLESTLGDYQDLSKQGHGKMDTSALIKKLQK